MYYKYVHIYLYRYVYIYIYRISKKLCYVCIQYTLCINILNTQRNNLAGMIDPAYNVYSIMYITSI